MVDYIASLLTGIGGLLVGLAAVAGGLTAIAVRLVKIIRDGVHHTSELLHKLWESRWKHAALALIVVGAFLLGAHSIIPPPCPQIHLSVTSPANGAVVNQSQPVLGTIDHVCGGQHLWLILQPGGAGGGGYYPQEEVAVAGNAEKWSTATYFGRASRLDDGRSFTLLVAATDNSTNDQFRAYLAHGVVTHQYPALADLRGAAVLSEVTVIRGRYLGS